jgi:hypothetical protein
VRIELGKGTHVIGRVVDHLGHGVETEVTLRRSDLLNYKRVVTSDAQGRFEVDLLPGSWEASTSAGITQIFTLSGAQQEITLSASTACVLSVYALDVGAAWLVPADADLSAVSWETGTGLPQGTQPLALGGEPTTNVVACGRFVLVTMRKGAVSEQLVDLEPGRTVVRVAPAAGPSSE